MDQAPTTERASTKHLTICPSMPHTINTIRSDAPMRRLWSVYLVRRDHIAERVLGLYFDVLREEPVVFYTCLHEILGDRFVYLCHGPQ